ncbi:MAG: ABC transporter permease [Deltaproteobacteria bacterium]|nr:ABC transporter permease [Deltaproteobacteria bacterium]
MNKAAFSQGSGLPQQIPNRREEGEVIYSPGGIRRNGQARWRIMFEDLSDSRRLIWLLILRDISVRYRQSLLGYVWAVIPQIATVGVFAFLHAWRVLPMGQTRLPYVAYALWGISVWQLFAGCLSACTTSLASSGSLVTKINFPRESLVIAAVGQPVFEFLIRLLPVTAVFAWYGLAPSWNVVLLPILLIPVILLALGLGLVLSIANLAIKDIGNALGTVLTIGMFLTPVLYPSPVRWPFTLINVLNPVSPLLTATQDLIAVGGLTRPGMFALSFLFSVIVFLVGWRTFRVTILRAAAYA